MCEEAASIELTIQDDIGIITVIAARPHPIHTSTSSSKSDLAQITSAIVANSSSLRLLSRVNH
jgi:hypothetical protein